MVTWPSRTGMPATRINSHSMLRTKRRDGASLLLRIHIHALRQAPRAYLTALWWRLQNKRVRARAQFAPLLAVSPLAYRLWLRNEEPARAPPPGKAKPSIVALVESQDAIGAEQCALDSTLESLAAEGIAAVLVGTPQIPALVDAIGLIDWSEGPWLMPIVAGDVLAQGAAAAYCSAAAGTKARIVYADDDLLDGRGQRHAPHFKPAWNAELFHHFDYLTSACIVRASAQDLVDFDRMSRLVAAVVEMGGEEVPLHIPHVLHHRRERLAPRLPAALAAPAALPSISVIVPTRNRLDLLRKCIEGLAHTDYPDLEVIVVDNGSDDPPTLAWLEELDPGRYRVLRHPGPFNFSALNNRAAERATGHLLCLLNNDVEVIERGWLKTLAAQALRPEVGAVGAQLLYPDGRIQHAGVALGVGGGAAHVHRLLHPEEEGYFRRHALPQFVSAVTAACLVVQRSRFEAVGGLDETNFAVAFNDVDLCMRLNQRGWQSLYEPRATLIHHESVSRGLDRDPAGAARLAGELAALQAAWATGEYVDPFHHPQLNRFSERFVVRL